MASFRQMTNDGVLKRADRETIQYKDLHVEPGFNPDGRDDDDEDGESLFQFIMSGGRLPDLEVRPRDDGGVWIVDGHRRHKQLGRAIAAGAPLQGKDGLIWIGIKQFVGNDIDRVCRIATSNEGKKLTALQLADVYKRLALFGLTSDNIALRVGRTRAHVEQTLILAGANHDVQQSVRDGNISATLAIATVRAHGEAAGAVIAEKVRVAKADGKDRVTAATLAPWTPPSKFVTPLASNGRRLVDSMPPEDIAQASNAATIQDPDEIVTVRMSRHALCHFLQNLDVIDEARQAAENKAKKT